MELVKYTEMAFKKAFDFKTRSTRSEYWWFALACFLVSLILSFVSHVPALVVFHINLLFQLVVLIPSIAVGARRLHDIGKTGWLQLLILIPLIGWIVLLFFFVQPSQKGKNQYG